MKQQMKPEGSQSRKKCGRYVTVLENMRVCKGIEALIEFLIKHDGPRGGEINMKRSVRMTHLDTRNQTPSFVQHTLAEQCHDLLVSFLRSNLQWGLVVLVEGMSICAIFEQNPRDLYSPVIHRQMK
jgi:hypothetical protein